MHEDIRERVARFEHALIVIAAMKPEGPITSEDEERAETVADAVARYEDRLRLARVKLPPPPVVTQGAPSEPAPKSKRPYVRRAPGTVPKRQRRPRKTTPPPAG